MGKVGGGAVGVVVGIAAGCPIEFADPAEANGVEFPLLTLEFMLPEEGVLGVEAGASWLVFWGAFGAEGVAGC